MRQIVLMSSVSLDGYMEGPDHDISWHRVDDELHQHFNDVLRGMGAFLDGRRTYELMAEYWPTADADPAAPGPVREFAGIWRDMPKVVYSRTLETVGPNTTLLREVVVDEVLALKASAGGDLALGGADLARTFLAHGLVDAFRIYVHPVLLGAGVRLFGDHGVDGAGAGAGAGGPDGAAASGLQLVETHEFGNGVVLLHHARAAGL